MAYLSAADFLTGIIGQEEDVEIAGLGTVRIRPLTAIEAGQLYDTGATPAELAVRAVALALVEPKLTDAELEQLQRATAGRLTPLINRVMALAGLTSEPEVDGAPLAGGGS